MAIPNRLAQLRERSRLTQEEVAKIIGIDSTTVSKHESGDRSLSDVMIKEYAKLYKVDTHELFIEPSGEGDVAVDGK